MGPRIDYRLVCRVGCRCRGTSGGNEKEKGEGDKAGPRRGRHSRAGRDEVDADEAEAERLRAGGVVVAGVDVDVGGWSVLVSVLVVVVSWVSLLYKSKSIIY